MRFSAVGSGSLLIACCVALSGCSLATKAELDATHARSRVLSEQNRAQLAEIENLKVHSRSTEDQLRQTELRLAAAETKLEQTRQQLAGAQRDRRQIAQQAQGLANLRGPMPPEVSRRLADLARQCPNLQFDVASGIGKFDTEILFDSGRTDLKPGATRVLDELVEILRLPEANDLKVLVVGHTDDQAVVHKSGREAPADNFDLSTARAQTVAAYLRRLGLEEQRLGVAGFASHQPIAPNVSGRDRQKNRRVEIFVMAADAPVVGWTESIPSVYH